MDANEIDSCTQFVSPLVCISVSAPAIAVRIAVANQIDFPFTFFGKNNEIRKEIEVWFSFFYFQGKLSHRELCMHIWLKKIKQQFELCATLWYNKRIKSKRQRGATKKRKEKGAPKKIKRQKKKTKKIQKCLHPLSPWLVIFSLA